MSQSQPELPELPPQQTVLGRVFAVIGVLLGGVYLLNPGAGLFELIPDIIPWVGNLDEAAAAGLVLYGLRYLGIAWRKSRA